MDWPPQASPWLRAWCPGVGRYEALGRASADPEGNGLADVRQAGESEAGLAALLTVGGHLTRARQGAPPPSTPSKAGRSVNVRAPTGRWLRRCADRINRARALRKTHARDSAERRFDEARMARRTRPPESPWDHTSEGMP
jgi:hypothetical protein